MNDPGVIRVARDVVPELPLHLSTQANTLNAEAALFWHEAGIRRIVLARELSLAEIRAMRAALPDTLELEIFVHGAMCVSYSGRCLLSNYIAGRDSNRGECAQPCRWTYELRERGRDGEYFGVEQDALGTYILNARDMNLIAHLKEVIGTGACSLKIEGRMKRPEYVAAAVRSAREALDGAHNSETQEKLRAVFSRSGFTDGYFENARGPLMFGTRRREDVVSASGKVLSSLKNLYSKEMPRVPVSFFLNVIEGEKLSLSARSGGKTVFVSSDFAPQKAVSSPVCAEQLSAWLSKCGATPFYPERIELEDGLSVPSSAVNALRREALEKLENELKIVKPHSFTDRVFNIEPHKAREKMSFHLVLSNGAQIPENTENVENLYFPLGIEEKYVESVENKGITVGVSIPRALFGAQERVEKLLLKAKNIGVKAALCGSLDAVALAEKCGLEAHLGFSMNVFNSLSIAEFERIGVKSITLSPELTLAQCAALGGDVERGIVAYGKLPLMLTRNCPVKNVKSCAECKGKSSLTDRMGVSFPVLCHGSYQEILNSRPIYMADRQSEIKNIDFLTFLFSKESAKNVDAVLDAYREEKGAKGNFTRGLFYRGVE